MVSTRRLVVVNLATPLGQIWVFGEKSDIRGSMHGSRTAKKQSTGQIGPVQRGNYGRCYLKQKHLRADIRHPEKFQDMFIVQADAAPRRPAPDFPGVMGAVNPVGGPA